MAVSDDLKSKVKTQFGAAAEGYVTSEIHAKGESLTYLAQFIKPQPQWQVLDVGTGTGHTAFLFAPHVKQVVATDMTKEMLIKCREMSSKLGLTNIETKTGDAEALPIDAQSFDLVTCRLAFHHFPHPEKALNEFSRVLKPGGVLGFTDNVTITDEHAARYYNAYEKLRDPSHNYVYSSEKLQEMIKDAGFQITNLSPIQKKEVEFNEWADRQNVSEIKKRKLIKMMHNVPEPLKQLFAPRFADKTMYFNLWEVVIVAKKM